LTPLSNIVILTAHQDQWRDKALRNWSNPGRYAKADPRTGAKSFSIFSGMLADEEKTG